jgi:hypothetical protein
MKYEHIGILNHNRQGRLELEDGYYFTSGDSIEIKIKNRYVKGRIEYSHQHKDYYFINEELGIKVYDLKGMKARV